MIQQQHRYEPQEREDPRNALLDTMAQQIVDMLTSAVENEVIEPLLGRIEATAPTLAKRLTVLREAAASADAAAAAERSPALAPQSCGLQEAAQAAAPARGAEASEPPPFDPVDMARVLAPLQLSAKFRMSPEHRSMFEHARRIVGGWMQQTTRPRRTHVAEPAPAMLPATAGLWDHDAGSGA